MTEGSRGLPSPPEVIELLGGDFTRAGYEIDSVTVDTASRQPRITVVADGDRPLDLDTIADLSRLASERLDAVPGIDDSYLLEVTSPGVERPLTAEKHFRRAHARLVELSLSDGSRVTGRIAAVGDGQLRIVVKDRSDWVVRTVPLADITKAVVQVEFSSPGKRELDLVGQTGREAQA